MTETKQYWRISVKGYHAQIFKDSSIGSRHDGKSYQDEVYGYGYVFFYGTKEGVGDEEIRLLKSGCKVLGSKPWQPDTDGLELKKRVKALSDKANKKFHDLVNLNDERQPEIGWMGRMWNGSRHFTTEELKRKAVADRIWTYYIKKFISPYL